MFDLEEVVTIERGEWRSVETNNGGECMCDDMWDKIDSSVVLQTTGIFRRRWIQIFSIPIQYHAGMVFHVHCIIIITLKFNL